MEAEGWGALASLGEAEAWAVVALFDGSEGWAVVALFDESDGWAVVVLFDGSEDWGVLVSEESGKEARKAFWGGGSLVGWLGRASISSMVWTIGVLCGLSFEVVALVGSVVGVRPVEPVEGRGERREGVGLAASVDRGVAVEGGAEEDAAVVAGCVVKSPSCAGLVWKEVDCANRSSGASSRRSGSSRVGC